MTSSTNTKKGKRSAKRVVGIVVSCVAAAALVAVVVESFTSTRHVPINITV